MSHLFGPQRLVGQTLSQLSYGGTHDELCPSFVSTTFVRKTPPLNQNWLRCKEICTWPRVSYSYTCHIHWNIVMLRPSQMLIHVSPIWKWTRISTLGKERRSIHRDKLVDKAWHEKSSVSTQCSKKFGEYCSIHQHAGIFGKKCGKLAKRATLSFTSKYFANVKFLSEKIRVIARQQDELDSRAGQSPFKLYDFV